MGAPQRDGECRGADLHLDRRHATLARESGLLQRDARSYSPGPHRPAHGRRWRRGLPRLAGGVADHRRVVARGWRLVAGVTRLESERFENYAAVAASCACASASSQLRNAATFGRAAVAAGLTIQ